MVNPAARCEDGAVKNTHHCPKEVVGLSLPGLILLIAALPFNEVEQHIHHQVKLFSGRVSAV